MIEHPRNRQHQQSGVKKLPLVVLGLALALVLGAPEARAQREGVTGPDVTVIYLPNVTNYGESGGIRGYSVGTTSCNVGNAPLWWCNDVGDPYCEINQHPVIAQNLYRLKEGRFEQIGMSWLKHGFLSLNTPDPACGTCVTPPHGGDQLGVGCTDAYSSGLNGSRPLGMRSEVNPYTGDFPYPYTAVSSSAPYDQRIKVDEIDLDPALNPGARYWIEGHYIAADDAESANSHNNASHREVTVDPSNFNLQVTGNTIREQPAIMAWKAVDPEVELHMVDVIGSGHVEEGERFNVARKLTADGAVVRYEYAIHNLQSDRAANRFTIQFPGPVEILDVGFHDVKHHSGEPYATTDWAIEVDQPGGSLTWYTDDFATDPNANALRWGTMFSFWFETYAAPDDAVHTLGLFKPGSPSEVTLPFSADSVVFFDGFESGDTTSWSVTVP